MHKILVIGGYGFFGARICSALSKNPSIKLLIGGRDQSKALALARSLNIPADQAICVDAADQGLADVLKLHDVDTVIHTAGPFQAQDYFVARAAISAGCHYIDLADGRDFVCGIDALNQDAQSAGVSVISGASSVPGLSSAVIRQLAPLFARIDAIHIGIGSGARAPGIATVRGVFSYCGHPIRRWQDGSWRITYGWLDLIRHHFPDPVGSRFLGSCDVPDLALFPKLCPSVRTVTFHAGFAGSIGHLGVWSLSALVRAGLLRSLLPFAGLLNRLSRWMEPLVSDKGGMFVKLEGLDHKQQRLKKTWSLIAEKNHGPHIPCGAAIALAHKFAQGTPMPLGAMPCAGLLTVEEFLAPLQDLAIREVPP